MSGFDQQLQKMRSHPGFLAALDQSGGSTPGALRLYGIKEGAWSTEDEMFALVHQMRTRLITSPKFTGERLIGTILFENTLDRTIETQPTADYLWNVKGVVPFLKVDKGLEAENDGVQLMKPIPSLAALLDKARSKRIFGTKMRSFIKKAVPAGFKNIVRQQFKLAGQILSAGLVPIVEPEVDIHCPEKIQDRGVAQSGDLGEARCAAGRSTSHAQAHATGAGRPPPRTRPSSQSCESSGIVGWLHAGRSKRPFAPKSWHRGELLTGTASGAVGPTNRF
jgi:fructose-bisphosphate aldolase class I